MSPMIREHLAFLYGGAHPEIAEALAGVMARAGALPGAGDHRGGAGFTQQDALLIAYPDQVRDLEGSPLRALGRFADRHLGGIVSGIHLLPFYPSSSDDGFSVMDYSAVDPAFGTWDDVRGFRPRFDLMFDAVLNHASAQGEWFRRSLAGEPACADYFVEVEGDPDLRAVVRPRTLPLLTTFDTHAGRKRFWTTFSADQVDLNYRNPRVLLDVVETLLAYVRNGARFLRLDAVAFLWKEIGTSCLHLPQTHRIIQLLRAVLDEVVPEVALVTETNVPHADNVSYFGDGTNEAQMVYNFALPGLVLHAMTTGDAGRLTRWARALTLPSDRVTFFNFLASHDGIGLNGVRGILTEDEIGALARHAEASGGFVSFKSLPDGGRAPYELNVNLLDALAPLPAVSGPEEAARRFLTAHAVMTSLRGVPGLYFHSVVGARGDREGALASGIPRRVNRQKFHAPDLEQALAEAGSLSARVHEGFRRLMGVRRSTPAFHPFGPQEVLSLDERVFAVERRSPDGAEVVRCLHNLSGHSIPAPIGGEATGVPPALTGVDLLTGRRFDPGQGASAGILLGPWETVWVRVAGR